MRTSTHDRIVAREFRGYPSDIPPEAQGFTPDRCTNCGKEINIPIMEFGEHPRVCEGCYRKEPLAVRA
ncbi:MAG: hypothetical protein ABEK01_04830 [Candidatus Nanohaloarchaea archaeon]